jgi:hypothetical protein
VALFGAQDRFFQDADTLIMKNDDIIEVLHFLRTTFPTINRITSYCRSRTACHKSVEDLGRLREAGLTRVHIGLESGYDPLLEFMRKGVTAAEHIEGGRRIMASGISLCEFVIPGLGGSRWSREHALATAEVLNEIKPDYIRPRSLLGRQGTTLYDRRTRGEFQPLGEDDIIRELRFFLEHLNGIQSRIASDHVLNLLEELEGKLPEDRDRMIGMIDRYLSLPAEDRMIFRLGRRQGVYRDRRPDDRQTYLGSEDRRGESGLTGEAGAIPVSDQPVLPSVHTRPARRRAPLPGLVDFRRATTTPVPQWDGVQLCPAPRPHVTTIGTVAPLVGPISRNTGTIQEKEIGRGRVFSMYSM